MRQIHDWDSPVLASTLPVIEAARNVSLDEAAIERVASWMAYEEFGLPDGSFVFDFGTDPMSSSTSSCSSRR
jgi:hypothetical protein